MPSSLTHALQRHSTLPPIDINTASAPPDSLLQALRHVPDPRDKRGIRYPFAWLLAACLCAALCGDTSLRRMAECAKRLAVEAGQKAPATTTIQRLLQRVDPYALDTALAAWAAQQGPAQVIAIDGKELRSAKRGCRDRVHLLAATEHISGTVSGQINVSAKTNEITQPPRLLEQLDQQCSLQDATVTIDALHTQRMTARLITETYRGHYVMTVKENQPTLYSQAQAHPWDLVPTCDIQEDTSRGRVVTRELKIITPTGVLASTWASARKFSSQAVPR